MRVVVDFHEWQKKKSTVNVILLLKINLNQIEAIVLELINGI